MVGIVVVSHSRALAAAVIDLVHRTVSPRVPIAFSGGTGDQKRELGTDAAEIYEKISEVYSDDGVLVLMDMGSAVLSAETAKDFFSPEQKGKVRLASAALVEGAISAAVQSQIGASLEIIAQSARDSLLPKQDQLGEPLQSDTAVSLPQHISGDQKILELQMKNEHGLHLRPAAKLIGEMAKFACEVFVENVTAKRGPVPAKSLVEVTRLQIVKDDLARFTIKGNDPEAASSAIRALIDSLSDEGVTQPMILQSNENLTVPVSSGVAVGVPYLFTPVYTSVPDHRLNSEPEIKAEVEWFRAAIQKVVSEQNERVKSLGSALHQQELGVFEAQTLILKDPMITREVEAGIVQKHLNAAAAWAATLAEQIAEQENAQDPYFQARAADFREAYHQVLAKLVAPDQSPELSNVPDSAILICEELTPILAERVFDSKIAGVIQLMGSSTSHGAILARGLGIPAVGGAKDLRPSLRGAERVALDGTTGQIWIDPSPEEIAEISRRSEEQKSEKLRLALTSLHPAITTDGVVVALGANAGSARDIQEARKAGAEFVGLFRSEFLFQRFTSEPTEEEQHSEFVEALTSSDLPITIRLLDVGGDKPLPFLEPGLEANPFLGTRGVRLLLAKNNFFRSHLRALLRVAVLSQVRILIPMVTELAEIFAVKGCLSQAHDELVDANISHRWPIQLGAMIETPAAALLSDQLAQHLDFFSLGTNDLTQYVLSAERGNAALARFSDALHPAILEVIRIVLKAADRHQIGLSLCGETAADPVAIPVWLALGIRSFSISSRAVPATKELVRKLDISELTKSFAEAAPKMTTLSDVRRFGQRSIANNLKKS